MGDRIFRSQRSLGIDLLSGSINISPLRGFERLFESSDQL